MSLGSQGGRETAVSSPWRTLYRVGGAAPLITIAFYLSEFILIPWERYPTSTEEWFALFQRSKWLGLLYLNAIDIFSVALLGVMFLALYVALRSSHESWMAVAAFFGFLGTAAFIVPRVAMLSMLQLSDRYAIATTEVERARILAAGETLGALGTPTPQTMGFLFMAIGVLIISLVMLRNGRFHKITAYFGIAASLFTFADHISVIGIPALATPLMILSGLFWIPWWVMIGWGLFRLANSLSENLPIERG
jgi:hypothetical protein